MLSVEIKGFPKTSWMVRPFIMGIQEGILSTGLPSKVRMMHSVKPILIITLRPINSINA